jgi:CDP-diacylglycerol--glycerol-3-phosphate 3-phosphatidyltransferase
MPFNLPIALTWLRVAAIPLLVAIFYLPNSWLTPFEKNLIAAIIFISAAITDWLDGFLARRLKQESAFGQFLDPVAEHGSRTSLGRAHHYWQRNHNFCAQRVDGFVRRWKKCGSSHGWKAENNCSTRSHSIFIA